MDYINPNLYIEPETVIIRHFSTQKRDFSIFKYRLGQSESSGKYYKVVRSRRGKFLGKYQFGRLALRDLGYINKLDKWTGKHGITSAKVFLRSPKIQEKAMDKWLIILENGLKVWGGTQHIGKVVQGVKITLSGLLAGAHIGGAKGASKFAKYGYNPRDKFGTTIRDYVKKFQDIKLR